MSVDRHPSAAAQAEDVPARARIGVAESSRVGIGQMTALLGINPRALRFYQEPSLVQVRRDRLGRRVYDWRARRWLQWIVDLRRAGVGLPTIRAIFNLDKQPDQAVALAARALNAQAASARARLAAVGEALRRCEHWADPNPAPSGLRWRLGRN